MSSLPQQFHILFLFVSFFIIAKSWLLKAFLQANHLILHFCLARSDEFENICHTETPHSQQFPWELNTNFQPFRFIDMIWDKQRIYHTAWQVIWALGNIAFFGWFTRSNMFGTKIIALHFHKCSFCMMRRITFHWHDTSIHFLFERI